MSALRPQPGPLQPVRDSGRGVLVVDDEATLARNIAAYLERLGWAVQVAGSAEEGLAMAVEFRPEVVLLDHNLPGASGLETLPRWLALDPQLRVVMMTGFGSVDLAVSAMKAGAADYLNKPLALAELRLLLERLVDQQRLRSTVDYYRAREASGSGADKIAGHSPAIVALRERIGALVQAERALADGEPPTVLIQGETGTGKALVARALHYDGPRAAGPFVEINCGAMPAPLIEAELFGYERGAFTDARQRKAGLVEAAHGGTLFLDEIGEAEPALQTKLLKLLEDRHFRRLGSVREQGVDLRVVAATHRPLEQLVREGRFRADLFFRLRIVELPVPPLRERDGDIAWLGRHFLAWHARRYRRPVPQLQPAAEQLLLRHAWPGNVRELRNAMEQALLLARGDSLGPREFAFLAPAGPDMQPGPAAVLTDDDLHLERAERRLIEAALERTGDNVTQAARLLGISRDTLRYRLERLQLRLRDS